MKLSLNPFFSERQPLTKEQHARSLRQASKVRFWKFVLPCTAFGIVFSLCLWPLVEAKVAILMNAEKPKRTMPLIKMTTELLNPRLNTLDAKGRPVVMKAESATQMTTQNAHFIKPQSHIHMENGQQIMIKADKGHYDQPDQRLDYKDHVELHSQNGITLQTSSASLNINTNQAEGHAPVSGSSHSTSLQGEGFKILKEGQELHLLGKSKISFNN